MQKLGEALLSVGALTAGTLNRALMLQRSTGGRLGTILLEQGLVTEETLARALAKVTGRNYAHWDRLKAASPDVFTLIPAKIALRTFAIPFDREGRVIRFAMRDPNDLAAEDELALVTGKRVEPWVSTEFRIAEALERFYGERRSARFRVLSERIERGIKPAGTPPAPPPPPPDLRGGERTGPVTDVTPNPARNSDVWRITRESSDEIEIATWRPVPFARPSTPTPAGELEFSIDEHEEPAAETAATTGDSSLAPQAGEPSPAAKARAGRKKEAARPAPPPPPAPISLDEARDRILSAQARDDIAEAALDHLAGTSPLVALFIARKDDVIGWQARGEGVSRSTLRSVAIPFTSPSIFLNVKLSGTPYQGVLPDLPSHEELVKGLGRLPVRCAVYPVSLKKRVVAFMLVELPDGGLSAAAKEDLAALAGAMAEGFAALILQQRGRAESA
ncbi:MAG TPA: hypothetical protein VFS34_11765 [Thermoanaerobaculia bacterium]|nr:hypothetical protein [Thermoanaerobaculia bacterium]